MSGKSANHSIVLRPNPGSTTVTKTTRYSAGITLDGAGNVTERSFGLPGGVSVTKRASSQVWSFPNLHGDVAAVADQNGAKQGATFTYDPYGNSLNGQIPDNKDGQLDAGWIGARSTEHETGMAPIIEMGARQYDPRLGRFLEVDPIEGGSCNDYDYVCGNPIGRYDTDGTCWVLCGILIVVLIGALVKSYLDAKGVGERTIANTNLRTKNKRKDAHVRIVIGRFQGRVNEYASGLGKLCAPRDIICGTFDPKLSGRMPTEKLVSMNKEWLEGYRDAGIQIIDIGAQAGTMDLGPYYGC